MTKTFVLPLEATIGGFNAVFNAAAVCTEDGITLVDVGLPGFLTIVEDALEKQGFSLADVKRIVITHHDGDHMGALRAILSKYPSIEVLSSDIQADYITGKKKMIRQEIAEQRLRETQDAAEKLAMEGEIKRISRIETIDTVQVVRDGEAPAGSGVRLLEVSGHMPGHMCVYIPEEKTLITGDALTAREGVLCPPDKGFTLDMPMALASLRKLLDIDIDTVICYHGGVVKGNIRERLREIIQADF